MNLKIKYQLLPKLVDKYIELRNRCIEKKLRRRGVTSILVDNTVLFHGVTHETAWIPTGKKKWGETEVETGYLSRIPVHEKGCEERDYASIEYLPSIIDLAKRGMLELCLSDELNDEQWTQPMGRFRGYGAFDGSLFRGVNMRIFHDRDYTFVIGSGSRSFEDQRIDRLASKSDPLYHELVRVLGRKNSQDIWHILTAERNSCYCFLTMDFKLIKNIEAQKNNPVVKSLKTRVLTPEKFGLELSLPPISPRFYSYHHADFPVNTKFNWHNSKRQKPKKNT
ncbi:hypothetical protein CWB60_07145 [Pseudoalteromonas sp. S327]|uniref:hypothetical protein n=1 Tax=unclassified Pseudoalteromonas TaxID=194690 RepID=UPI00110B4F81|nr:MULTISPECIES: hypothetical protein [unclassified Pseudoalteromonas]TMO07815.1 hypothetical protein CWB60_07145 [Pseudoalteromonas sp. S327]TMO15500.1 hypothetical protein CWB59_15340 [Pseudoalteromonas sp. S326]